MGVLPEDIAPLYPNVRVDTVYELLMALRRAARGVVPVFIDLSPSLFVLHLCLCNSPLAVMPPGRRRGRALGVPELDARSGPREQGAEARRTLSTPWGYFMATSSEHPVGNLSHLSEFLQRSPEIVREFFWGLFRAFWREFAPNWSK